MPRKLTHSYIKSYIEGRGYKLISSDYKNSKELLDLICPRGHNIQRAFTNFRNDFKSVGNGCAICSGKHEKYDYSFIKSKFTEEGYELISDVYNGSHLILKIKCTRNHIYKGSYNNFHRGSRCPECHKEDNKGEKSNNWRGHKEVSGHYWSQVKRRHKNKYTGPCASIEYASDLFIKQGKRCRFSGVKLDFGKGGTASLDRINSSKGYTEENIQWVHKDINWMKQDFSDTEFIKMCKEVAEYNK